MRPTHLELEGFLSYRDAVTLDLTAIELGAITGRIGSGKSAVLDAVLFALYGVTRSATKDGVIHTESNRCDVSMTFDHAGCSWRVRRTTTRSGTTRAYLDRRDVGDWAVAGDAGGKVGPTDAAIRDLIALSPRAFSATVMVEQGRSAAFTDSDPAERHRLLAEILDLGIYDQLADAAKERVRLAKTDRQRLVGRVAELETFLADADEASAQATELACTAARYAQTAAAQRASAEELDARRSTAEQQYNQAAAELAAHDQAATDAGARAAHDRERAAHDVASFLTLQQQAQQELRADENAAAAHPKLSEARANFDDTVVAHQRELDRVVDRGHTASARVSALSAQSEALSAQLGVENERLTALTRSHGEGTCWACSQTLSPNQITQMITERETTIKDLTQRREQAIVDHTAAQTHVQDLRQEHRAISQALTQARNDLASVVEQLNTASRAAEALPDRRQRHSEASTRLTDAQERLADAEQRIKAAHADTRREQIVAKVESARVERIDQATVDTAFAATQDADRAAADTQTRAAVAGDRVERHNQARQALGALRSEDANLASAEDDWSRVAQAYGTTGVPRMILEGAVDELSQDVAAELQTLSNGTLSAQIKTERLTRSGTTKSMINVEVTGPDGARDYATFSGGQRFLIDIALHLGLSRLLARRTGTPIRMLAIDEGWGSLEGEEQSAMLRALTELREHFDLVLTVTHVDEVAQSMPQRIEVAHEAGTSQITVLTQ